MMGINLFRAEQVFIDENKTTTATIKNVRARVEQKSPFRSKGIFFSEISLLKAIKG